MRALPLLSQSGFGTAEGMGSVIKQCASLLVHNDVRRQLCGGILWALLGVMLLAVEKRGQRLSNAQRKARLDLFIAGDYRTLVTAFCANHAKQSAADVAELHRLPAATLHELVGAERDGAALARRALKHVEAGALRQAMETLRDSTVGVRGPEILPPMEAAQKVPAFPASEELQADIMNFVPAALHEVDMGILRKAVAGMRPNAAGGPNGIRTDHMLPGLDVPGALEMVAEVVQSLLSGKMDAKAAELLTASNLHALCKRAEPDAKPRPIACGDWLTRLTGRYVTCVLRDLVPARLEPLQLGSSHNGSEAAFHSVSAYLRLHTTKMALMVDQLQAFQHVSRSVLFEQLMADPELAWTVPFLRYLYASGSDLLLDLGPCAAFAILRSEEGVRQGGPESSLLYNIITLVALRAVASGLAQSDGSRLADLAVGIVDDVTIVCSPDNAVEVLALLQREYEKLGCVMNRDKTKALYLSGRLPAAFRLPVDEGGSGLAEANCIDQDTPAAQRGVRLLGAPIGSVEFVADWLEGNKCFGDVHRDLGLVCTLLEEHTQAALALIKSCIITRVTHLARLLPPAVIVPHLQRFDQAVAAAVCKLVGVDSAALVFSGHPALAQMHLREVFLNTRNTANANVLFVSS